MSSSFRPARFHLDDLARPALGPLDVVTTLADFAMVTYEVAPEELAKHLAPGVKPDIFTLDNGNQVSLVSAVVFQDLDFRFHQLDGLRFKMGQTNYRAYVTYEGRRCVWFLGTSLTMPWVLIPTLAWSLPWHGVRMSIDSTWLDETRLASYRFEAHSHWGTASLELGESTEPMGRLDGFLDEEDAAVILTHPLEGYFYRRDGRMGSYSVWHDRLRLSHARYVSGSFEVFEQPGLVKKGATPHSVLVQRETEFVIHLPPFVVG